jgi:prevent-host-death family protein
MLTRMSAAASGMDPWEMDAWKLQDAKARFSEVVDRALRDGPQLVTRHGENAVVIVAYRDFVGAEPTLDFKDFLMSIPRVGLEIKPSRRRPRRIEL